jgi:hypothetical protein
VVTSPPRIVAIFVVCRTHFFVLLTLLSNPVHDVAASVMLSPAVGVKADAPVDVKKHPTASAEKAS